jgi:hypothetical protein
MPTAKRDFAPPPSRRAFSLGAGLAAVLAAAGAGAARATEGPVETFRIRAAIDSIDHWVFFRQVLAALPGGRGLAVVRLGAREAVFDFRFAGDASALIAALAEKGLDLARDGEQGWALRPAEAAPPPPRRP